MFIPDYSITNNILKNISVVEYGKAVIDNTTILPNWYSQLARETKLKAIYNSLLISGFNVSYERLKLYVDGLDKAPLIEAENLFSLTTKVDDIAYTSEFNENDLKDIHRILSKNVSNALPGNLRSKKLDNATKPEEVLAEVVQLLDWYHSLDAKDTHPIITAGLMRAKIVNISPFETMNYLVANASAYVCLKIGGYELKNLISFEDYFRQTQTRELGLINALYRDDADYTDWLEYFTEALAHEVSKMKEKVLLLAKDTKVAKASGRTRLTSRQERIVEHLQDYGILQNKDFSSIFPNISEDSVLRDLKALIDKGIIVKVGKTKNSAYELR